MGIQETWKAMSDPTRRKILRLLRDKPLTAGEIGEHFPATGATISHHLAILKQARLISDTKQGKYIFYELNLSVLEEMMSWMTALIGGDHHERENVSADSAEHTAPADGGSSVS